MIILKFGGTSLESWQRIATVVEIIRGRYEAGGLAVVVSEPPADRASDNPWLEWPRILRVDYGTPR